MTIQMLQAFFMWWSIINMGLLILSTVLITTAGDWAYKMHSRWFNISRVTFNTVIYSFIGFYKILVFVFCIVPWIALAIIG